VFTDMPVLGVARGLATETQPLDTKKRPEREPATTGAGR
jgi:hypothetical protein